MFKDLLEVSYCIEKPNGLPENQNAEMKTVEDYPTKNTNKRSWSSLCNSTLEKNYLPYISRCILNNTKAIGRPIISAPPLFSCGCEGVSNAIFEKKKKMPVLDDVEAAMRFQMTI